jgi:hypothetical protein
MMKFESTPQKREETTFDKPENQVKLARKLSSVYIKRPELKGFVGMMADDPRFASSYTKEAVEKDEQYVENVRKSIEEKNSSRGRDELDRLENGFALSEMLQAMVVDRINDNWLKEFKAIMTSDYDDLHVGADAVLKHKTGQYLSASFDFTVTNQEKLIEQKLAKVWEYNVEGGSVPTIKYFQDPDTGVKGRILAPKFIIGASKKDVEDLAQSYLDDKIENLNNHKFQYMIIEQMYEQVVSVLDYFEKHHDDPKLRFAHSQYEKIYIIVQRIRDGFNREDKIQNDEFREYSNKSIALETMKRFQMSKQEVAKEY